MASLRHTAYATQNVVYHLYTKLSPVFQLASARTDLELTGGTALSVESLENDNNKCHIAFVD